MSSFYAAKSLVNIVVIAEECFGRDGLTREELLRINGSTYKADIDPVLDNFHPSYAANFIHLRKGRYTLRNKNNGFKTEEKLKELTQRLGHDPAEIFNPT